MERFLAFPLEDIPLLIIVLAIAFSVHEFAHAYVAYRFGDPTAKNQGRLTLSPLAHLDVFGTIMIFIAGFGWAKPVPVNRFHFKNPRLAGVLVSLAGPLSNLVLVIVGFLIWYGMVATGVMGLVPESIENTLYQFFNLFILLNIILCVFNLLPFPPLDGYRMIEDLTPHNIRAKLTQYENYGILLFLILVITPLDQYTITPIFNVVIPFVFEAFDQLFLQVF
ncbi:site-2 protease family protein [Calidifontibacillus oryziterrae]|uniref:site-2 protease family protein n=1 Tax=Calidifontibacillus oryziterrae TaxID=1191699 RepID=UPI0002F95470|nr:site-2 protease family protein [Calidifontibacillus oryziterrae]